MKKFNRTPQRQKEWGRAPHIHTCVPERTSCVCTLKAFTASRSLFILKKDTPVLFLFAGVPLAVPTPLDCRRQAFA